MLSGVISNVLELRFNVGKLPLFHTKLNLPVAVMRIIYIRNCSDRYLVKELYRIVLKWRRTRNGHHQYKPSIE